MLFRSDIAEVEIQLIPVIVIITFVQQHAVRGEQAHTGVDFTNPASAGTRRKRNDQFLTLNTIDGKIVGIGAVAESRFDQRTVGGQLGHGGRSFDAIIRFMDSGGFADHFAAGCTQTIGADILIVDTADRNAQFQQVFAGFRRIVSGEAEILAAETAGGSRINDIGRGIAGLDRKSVV